MRWTALALLCAACNDGSLSVPSATHAADTICGFADPAHSSAGDPSSNGSAGAAAPLVLAYATPSAIVLLHSDRSASTAYSFAASPPRNRGVELSAAAGRIVGQTTDYLGHPGDTSETVLIDRQGHVLWQAIQPNRPTLGLSARGELVITQTSGGTLVAPDGTARDLPGIWPFAAPDSAGWMPIQLMPAGPDGWWRDGVVRPLSRTPFPNGLSPVFGDGVAFYVDTDSQMVADTPDGALRVTPLPVTCTSQHCPVGPQPSGWFIIFDNEQAAWRGNALTGALFPAPATLPDGATRAQVQTWNLDRDGAWLIGVASGQRLGAFRSTDSGGWEPLGTVVTGDAVVVDQSRSVYEVRGYSANGVPAPFQLVRPSDGLDFQYDERDGWRLIDPPGACVARWNPTQFGELVLELHELASGRSVEVTRTAAVMSPEGQLLLPPLGWLRE